MPERTVQGYGFRVGIGGFVACSLITLGVVFLPGWASPLATLAVVAVAMKLFVWHTNRVVSRLRRNFHGEDVNHHGD